MGSQIGNRRFPNLSNTNSQKCENSFSHSCKLALLSRRIVAHATCFIHSKRLKITIGTFIGLAYVENLMYFCLKNNGVIGLCLRSLSLKWQKIDFVKRNYRKRNI